jgi:hypothetical protein
MQITIPSILSIKTHKPKTLIFMEKSEDPQAPGWMGKKLDTYKKVEDFSQHILSQIITNFLRHILVHTILM